MSRRSLAAVLGSLLVLLGLAGCGGSSEERVTLRVFAAASLTETFTELATRFESDHPGTDVELNFGPSSGLAEQVASGAPADVFAAASPVAMAGLLQTGEVNDTEDFARNSLQIAVPPDNPAQVESLQDLGRRGVTVAVCQPQVPCGSAAADVFVNAGVGVTPVTEEVDVKSVLTKVTFGEVDAGLVYVSDVRAADGAVTGIEIPEDLNASTTYPIAVPSGSEHQRLAREFVDLVLSEPAGQVLEDAGFQRP